MEGSVKVRIDRSQYDPIAEFSDASGIPRAELIRQALDTFIDVSLPVMWGAIKQIKPVTRLKIATTALSSPGSHQPCR